MSMLDINGRAAVVLPDNVLFEGGAGETVRRKLLAQCDVHTLLRLPTGIFYAQGVKANVLFFDKKPAAEQPWTEGSGSTTCAPTSTSRSSRTRCADHLDDFVDCYQPGKDRAERIETERLKSFTYDELIARDKVNLDITWLRDESSRTSTTCPRPRSSPARSSRTSPPPSPSSRQSPPHWRRCSCLPQIEGLGAPDSHSRKSPARPWRG